MSKLYFKYGTMGSSKTAQALMTKFNYEQKGFKVFLIKPIIDKRNIENGQIVVKSRIGLSSPCLTFDTNTNVFEFVKQNGYLNEKCVVIVDEAQFCSTQQIDQLHQVSETTPVLCYGLLTNFKTQLFEGSKRLVEIAESLMEIKSVCDCGKKSTVNARFVNGELVTDGAEIMLGAEETYKSLCYSCYQKLKNNTK